MKFCLVAVFSKKLFKRPKQETCRQTEVRNLKAVFRSANSEYFTSLIFSLLNPYRILDICLAYRM